MLLDQAICSRFDTRGAELSFQLTLFTECRALGATGCTAVRFGVQGRHRGRLGRRSSAWELWFLCHAQTLCKPRGFLPTTEPSFSTFWVMLKLPDKQEHRCRAITLFGKNRAAKKGLGYLTPGEGSGLLLPSAGMWFWRAQPRSRCPEATGIRSIPICSISCWLMQCPDLMYLPTPCAHPRVSGFCACLSSCTV